MTMQQFKTKQHRWVAAHRPWGSRWTVDDLHLFRNEINDAYVPGDAQITFHDSNGTKIEIASMRLDHTKTTDDEGEPDAKDPDPARSGDGGPALADDEPGAGDTEAQPKPDVRLVRRDLQSIADDFADNVAQSIADALPDDRLALARAIRDAVAVVVAEYAVANGEPQWIDLGLGVPVPNVPEPDSGPPE